MLAKHFWSSFTRQQCNTDMHQCMSHECEEESLMTKCKSGKMQAKEMQEGCQMRLGQARAATDGGVRGGIPPAYKRHAKKVRSYFSKTE